MLDVLCIGDSVIDIFLKIPETNPNFGLDKDKNQLFISYGKKINVEKYVLDIGGNATNTAVGISRLGLSSGLCAEIGKDEFSQKIIDKLITEKINVDALIQNEKENTSFSVGLSFKGERTLLVEHVLREHNFNLEQSSPKLIYLTSLGNEWEKAYKNTLEFVTNNNIKLAFNPGTLQLEKRDKIIMDIIDKTDYLFLNKEEAQELLYGDELNLNLGKDLESLIKKLLFGLKSLGAKNVIITDSNNGSYLCTQENKMYSLGIVHAEMVEKTGAGDGYTAGFLSALLNNLSSQDAMVWGAVNSASVISKIGAEEGLLRKNELEEKLSSLGDFSSKEI